MPLYRKKPIVIRAVQFYGQHVDGVCGCEKADGPHIHTLEGDMYVELGDYVITGVKGEYYPCKADIFDLSYEEVS